MEESYPRDWVPGRPPAPRSRDRRPPSVCHRHRCLCCCRICLQLKEWRKTRLITVLVNYRRSLAVSCLVLYCNQRRQPLSAAVEAVIKQQASEVRKTNKKLQHTGHDGAVYTPLTTLNSFWRPPHLTTIMGLCVSVCPSSCTQSPCLMWL